MKNLFLILLLATIICPFAWMVFHMASTSEQHAVGLPSLETFLSSVNQ